MIDRAFAVVTTVIIVAAVFVCVLQIQGERRCLQAGYPTMKWGALTRYCVKRVNQTDSVVVLSSLPKQK